MATNSPEALVTFMDAELDAIQREETLLQEREQQIAAERAQLNLRAQTTHAMRQRMQDAGLLVRVVGVTVDVSPRGRTTTLHTEAPARTARQLRMDRINAAKREKREAERVAAEKAATASKNG